MTDEERDEILKKLDEKLDIAVDKTTKIHSVLFDTNGNKGLCSKVDDNGKNIVKIWIVIAFIAGSTGIGFGLVNWLS
jgi:hypothetical protein